MATPQRGSRGQVRIRVSEPDRLAAALRARGAAPEQVNGYLQVTGLSTDDVGRLAQQQQVAVLELFEQKSSLEAAFIEATGGSVDYHANTLQAAFATAAAEAVRDRRPGADQEHVRGREQGP